MEEPYDKKCADGYDYSCEIHWPKVLGLVAVYSEILHYNFYAKIVKITHIQPPILEISYYLCKR